MELSKRTQDIYEPIPAYLQPPLIPLPDLEEDASLTDAGIKANKISRFLVKQLVGWIGLKKNYARFGQDLEGILKRTNLRLPGLFSPLISATIALVDDPQKPDAFQRAAALVLGAHALCLDLFAGRLSQDTYKGEALEMGQYPNLFATSLAIEKRQVSVVKSANFNEIVVVYHHLFYKMQLVQNGNLATLAQLASTLRSLVERAEVGGSSELGPGILTAASSRVQLRAFEQMAKEPDNQAVLKAMNDSLLTLCLDLDSEPGNGAEAMTYGHSHNHSNRWYHASTQLIVFKNARACVLSNFTCYLDGNIMMRGAAEICRRAAALPNNRAADGVADQQPLRFQRLTLKVDQKWLAQAQKDVAMFSSEQPATFEIQGIGRKLFLDHSLSPVAVFMVALAMAAKKFTGKTPTITQFLTMSRFRYTDMVTANIVTPEVSECLRLYEQPVFDPLMVKEQLVNAERSQGVVTRQVRKHLSLMMIIPLYIRTLSGWRLQLSDFLYNITMLKLQLLGLLRNQEREILVSHPEIYPETPYVGRPGVRIPYARYFGLHYQIFDERTVLTIMPGMRWRVPNQALFDEIRLSLEKIVKSIEAV